MMVGSLLVGQDPQADTTGTAISRVLHKMWLAPPEVTTAVGGETSSR